jgi:thiol-disulfide isomerase/thioredoxin
VIGSPSDPPPSLESRIASRSWLAAARRRLRPAAGGLLLGCLFPVAGCLLLLRASPHRRGLQPVACGLLLSCLLPVACCLLLACNRTAHPAQVGERAPAVVIRDGAQTVALRDYQQQGKVVVLNFWASWCAYCAPEWPSLEQLQQRIPNLVVLAVAFDSPPPDYRQYLIDNNLHNMTVINDTSDQSNHAFDTTRPPETYIIDTHGVIRRKFIGAQDWSTPEIVNYLRNL